MFPNWDLFLPTQQYPREEPSFFKGKTRSARGAKLSRLGYVCTRYTQPSCGIDIIISQLYRSTNQHNKQRCCCAVILSCLAFQYYFNTYTHKPNVTIVMYTNIIALDRPISRRVKRNNAHSLATTSKYNFMCNQHD